MILRLVDHISVFDHTMNFFNSLCINTLNVGPNSLVGFFHITTFSMLSRLRRPFAASVLRFSSTVSRKERQAAYANRASSTFSPRTAAFAGVAALIVGGSVYSYQEIKNNPEGTLAGFYKNSFVESIVNSISGHVDDIFVPQNDRLLPDWPTAPCYQGIPPGTPCPPTLVVDVERTLVGSVHDARHGWRHVKRPGLDKFINALSQYYEIVLFSENDMGVAADILAAIDPEGKCHKLGSSAGEARGTLLLKRLDLMNRDISRIILIDDSHESAQLFPRNTLYIKPFNDVNDKTDMQLIQLIPLLQAMIHDGVSDFRDTIDDLGTHEAEEAVVEYKMRVSARKSAEYRKRDQGLGGLIRGVRNNSDDGEDARSSIILKPSQIVGGLDPTATSQSLLGFTPVKKDEKGPSVRKTGAMMNWLNEREKENATKDQLKHEKMNEIYQKREMEKRAKKAEAERKAKGLANPEDEEY